jgi:hypothetical protein
MKTWLLTLVIVKFALCSQLNVTVPSVPLDKGKATDGWQMETKFLMRDHSMFEIQTHVIANGTLERGNLVQSYV